MQYSTKLYLISFSSVLIQNQLYMHFLNQVKYLIHCIMSRGIGIVLLGTISLCFWNEISDKLAKHGTMKNMSEISYNNLLLSSHEIASIFEKTLDKELEKSKSAISSCSRYLARVRTLQVPSKFVEH